MTAKTCELYQNVIRPDYRQNTNLVKTVPVKGNRASVAQRLRCNGLVELNVKS